MIVLVSLAFLLAPPGPASSISTAPEILERGEASLRQALLDVACDFRLLAVAAHPDDEDLATLTVLRRRDGVQTAIALATRGEGGQNEIGPELYRALGVVRTREMEAAAEIHGARLFYLNLPDFGFSKTSAETFRIWGREEPTRRLVAVIRAFRPHVMISNHDTRSGHGNHQAIGAAMLEAFDRADDPDFAPELGEPWPVAKCYVRTAPDRANVAIETRECDEARGETFLDLASRALRQHRSQGMGDLPAGGGGGLRHFTRVRSRVGTETERAGERELFDGVPDLPESLRVWKFLAEARAVEEMRARIRDAPIPRRHSDLAPTLARDLARARSLASSRDLEPLAAPLAEFARRIEGALARSLDARIEVAVSPETLVPGEPVRIAARLETTAPRPETARLTLSGAVLGASVPAAAARDPIDFLFAGRLDERAPLTVPEEDHLYDAGEKRPVIRLQGTFRVAGQEVSVAQALRPSVGAPLDLSVAPRDALLAGGRPALVTVRLRNRLERPVRGTLELPGEAPRPFALAPRGQKVETIAVRAGAEARTIETRDVVATLDDDSSTPAARSAVTLHSVAVEVAAGLKVGVVESYDRTVSDTLRALAVDFRPLEAAELAASDLGVFDTILIDLRGYGARPDLRENAGRLIDYVKKGGHLVVFYHKTGDWSPSYAPLPLPLSGDRVTVETAPVRLLLPDHPLLSKPNRIAAEDFDGWAQERGLYFPKGYDRGYEELLAMADPGERELRGGLITCRAGRGSYVYTSLVWYRQLREFHPGAVKALANFVSYPRLREARSD